MEHQVGQIAEYGSPDFQNNKSVRTVLETGKIINPHGIERKAELYHRTEGYKPAGSCATYCLEIWGYTVYWNDGTNHGEHSTNRESIFDKWVNLGIVERQIVGQ